MTDELWTALIAIIEPLRGEIGQDSDGSVWRSLCERLSALLAQHGWPPLADARSADWDWVSTEHDGESLNLMVGLNDRLFLSVEAGIDVIREQTWYL